jgi:hypothetical protein
MKAIQSITGIESWALGPGRNDDLLIDKMVAIIKSPGNTHLPQPGQQGGTIDDLDSVRIQIEFQLAIEVCRGRPIQLDLARTFGEGLVGGQGNGDTLRGTIIGSGCERRALLRVLESIDLTLITDFFLVIVRGNQVSRMTAAKGDKGAQPRIATEKKATMETGQGFQRGAVEA